MVVDGTIPSATGAVAGGADVDAAALGSEVGVGAPAAAELDGVADAGEDCDGRDDREGVGASGTDGPDDTSVGVADLAMGDVVADAPVAPGNAGPRTPAI